MSRRISDVLPEFYRGVLPPFFNQIVPQETWTTCADCAMWEPGDQGRARGIYFSRRTKCCTFLPNLANFSVGALLSTQDGALAVGRRRIRQRIRSRIGVTPQGIIRPKKYSLLIGHAPAAFGKSQILICPYYDQKSGKCTIRPYGDPTCVTWFCKHVAGHLGRIFWKTLERYLEAASDALVQHTLLQMGLDPQPIHANKTSDPLLSHEELEERPLPDRLYQKMWGDWAGKEEALYKETYRLVGAVSPEQFQGIGGVRLAVIMRELEKAYREMLSPTLPPILKRRPGLVSQRVSEDEYLVVGYSLFDPVRLSARTHEILEFFDGKKTHDQVLKALKKRGLPAPDRALLLSLYQSQILVAEGE